MPVVPLRFRFFTTLLALMSAANVLAQPNLQQQLGAIAAEAKGKVSVACSLPGSPINCDLNPHAHPPMQFVFKLPLAVMTLHQIERGALSLDQAIPFRESDRILPHSYSPLQDKYPAI